MRGRLGVVVASATAFPVLLALSGCARSPAQTPQSQAAAPISVATTKPARGAADAVLSLTGASVPFEQVTLYSQASGYLRSLKADIGDRVRTGELLATIETPQLRAALGEKQALLQRALVTTEKSRATLEQVRAEAAFTGLTFQRLHAIRDRDPEVIPQQDVDQAKSSFDIARAKQHAAALDVDSSEASVLGVKAEMNTIRTEIDFGEIRSPLNGIVTERFVDPGALIQLATSSRTQAAPLLTVTRINRLRILFDVPEAQAGAVREGTPAGIRIAGSSFSARITRLTKVLDPASHTMRCEVDVENPQERLRPGMTALVSLNLTSHVHALLVPISALHTSGARHSVYVVRGGSAREVEVQTGVETPDRVEISQGLTGDEDVIIAAGGLLKDGANVRRRP